MLEEILKSVVEATDETVRAVVEALVAVKRDKEVVKKKLDEVANSLLDPPKGIYVFWRSYDRLKVPEVVIGEPVTFMPIGVDRATEVTVPDPVPTQIPLMAKQPVWRLMPLEKVEVEVSERLVAVPMPSNVEAVNLGKVEVALVEVAVKYSATV